MIEGAGFDFMGIALLASSALALVMGLMASAYRTQSLSALEDRAYMRGLLDNLSEGVYRSSLDGRLLRANRALVRLNGYGSEEEMLATVTDIASEWYVEPGRREELRALLERDGKIEEVASEIYRHKTRERIWVSESARLVRHSSTGQPLYYEGSVREISETMARLALEATFRKLTSHLPGALFQFRTRDGGRQVTVEYVSVGYFDIVEMSPEEWHATDFLLSKLVHPDDVDGYTEGFRKAIDGVTLLDHEFRIVTPRGTEKWLRMTAQREPGPGGEGGTWYGYISDVSLRKRQALAIEKLAYFDPLTDLPNRRMFIDRVTETMRRCGRGDTKGILLYIDLDNFKSLNDTQGHDVGDAYLVDVAHRLRTSVGPGDVVARMGGDEFVVAIETTTTEGAVASALAIGAGNRIMAALRRPFEHGDLRHNSSASIGVLVFGGDAANPDDLLKRADVAMYRAKASGRDAMALFETEWLEGEAERFTLLAELRKAIAEETLSLRFQPQMDRRLRVVGAEGLLRWTHPGLGSIAPDRFIPLAEQSGLIHALCRLVLDQAIRQLAAWARDPATAGLRLSVNISVQSFAGSTAVEGLIAMIESHGVDASLLTLEFTEHVTAGDLAAMGHKMAKLKALGVRFSLDDFGTGYSSLSRLKRLPFDEVKIDGSFVAEIDKSEEDRDLVRTILAIAETLRLHVVAEHVETTSQQDFLLSAGCGGFQGYLYAPALPAAEFERFVRASGTQRTPDRGEHERLSA
ncbi:putative bifunctional diguanylate cyclase/phosphodiesterase [Aquibium microcysteis]|uniref:putative bifunctional diguanylate cyclase/phosphodiesterase n=1 Tax=Aquibium microcysteis TaxID=675281 RepID=UPI00165D0CEE|nr:EAL domain-containing protein [Aquibium microcysteis]